MTIEAPVLADRMHSTGELCNQTELSRWDICLHTAIHADIRRVFNAVTMPEYREAWICPPDANDKCHVVALQTRVCYRIDIYRADALDTRITGSQRKWQPEEMEFTWRKRCESLSIQTMVHIHLHDKSGGTALDLVHSGFTSAAESLWHQRLWSKSLEKLTWLLEQYRV